MTADLAAFLRARLDDDKQTARAAAPGPWAWIDPGGSVTQALVSTAVRPPQMILPSASKDVYPSVHDAQYIARHDPARVLREIEAKRRTLVRCEEAMLSASPMLVHFAQQTVWEMALPYADHPDYPEPEETAQP